jgi:hypothetical protein
MTNQLLPCPFCAKTPMLLLPTLTKSQEHTDPRLVSGRFYSEIRCCCGAVFEGQNFDSDGRAVAAAWNNRLFTSLQSS